MGLLDFLFWQSMFESMNSKIRSSDCFNKPDNHGDNTFVLMNCAEGTTTHHLNHYMNKLITFSNNSFGRNH